MLSEAFLSADGKASEYYVNKYNNVFVINSYTKSFALPGLRMGYVMSTTSNISSLYAHLPEWNLSSVASSVMTKCARISAGSGYLKESVCFIRKERACLEDALAQLGFTVFGSDTVFILFKDETGTYKGLYERLLDGGILIRKCDNFEGLGEDFYRVAVRSRADNEKLTAAIRKIRDED
jgi:histidinol-phosphate/aromatic aminotransferase/cobyric acid decarboxylase-like protein